MSHIVTIKTEVRDADAVHAACRRLGLPEPVSGTTQLFSGEATGLAVQLPDWQYPVVCDTSKFIEAALGQPLSEQPTAAFYQTDAAQQLNQQPA